MDVSTGLKPTSESCTTSRGDGMGTAHSSVRGRTWRLPMVSFLSHLSAPRRWVTGRVDRSDHCCPCSSSYHDWSVGSHSGTSCHRHVPPAWLPTGTRLGAVVAAGHHRYDLSYLWL